jgi:hypothetical protein
LPRVGKNHPMWRGGKRKLRRGYIGICLEPDDPLISMATVHRKERIAYEHRVVIARSLGRPLHRWETVHHINQNKADNRMENLIIVINSRHRKIHNDLEKRELQCPFCQKIFQLK